MHRYGHPAPRKPAQQTWAVGAVVNVGFHKGLTITAKTADGWRLQSAKGANFEFAPHVGLFAI